MSRLFICCKAAIFLILLFPFISKAQHVVRGIVKDKEGNPIYQAQVIIYNAFDTKAIWGFTFSDQKGKFELKTKHSPDSLLLRVRFLGYREQGIYPITAQKEIAVTLVENPIAIDEVVVKSNPISIKGDTITYLVGSFAKAKDVSIGDVIKKMPNFDVDDNGVVYYEGKPIQKYYIEGVDLLENSYAIANKNLPYKAVAAVDVLKNHQPVRVLNDVLPSNNTSINIRLKRGITVTGTSKLGTGYKPNLYDINLTPMLFQKKFQLLTSLQANNIGQELESQVNELVIRNMDMIDDMIYGKPRFVSVQTLATPNIKMNRWLDNNALFFSSKTLFKLKSDMELKLNVNYYSDKIFRFGSTEKQYFVNDDGLFYAEATNNKFKKNLFRLSSTLTKNSNRIYLNSKTNFTREWETNNSEISVNSNLSNAQKANIPYFNLTNENDVVIKKNNRLWSFSTYFKAVHSNQNLSIQPGVFSDVLNNGELFNELLQNVDYKKYLFYSNFTRAYIVKPFVFRLEPKILIENGSVNSSMMTDGTFLTSDSLRSQKHWLLYKPGISPLINYKKGNLEVSLGSPIYLRLLNEKDIGYSTYGFKRDYIVEPGISVNYLIAKSWKISGSYGYDKCFGKPQDKLNGYIGKGIYLLSRNNFDIGESVSNKLTGSIEYANVLKGINFSTSAINVLSLNSYIFERKLLNTNLITYKSVAYPNSSKLLKLKTNFSWMLMKFSSSFAIKYEFSENKRYELVNNELKRVNNSSSTINFNLNTNILEDFELDYKLLLSALNYSSYKNRFHYDISSHIFSITYFASSKSFFCVETEFYKFDKNATANFINLIYTLKNKNNQYILNIACNNLLNTKTFDSYYVTPSMVEHSMISLRPQTFIVSLTMPLAPIKN